MSDGATEMSREIRSVEIPELDAITYFVCGGVRVSLYPSATVHDLVGVSRLLLTEIERLYHAGH